MIGTQLLCGTMFAFVALQGLPAEGSSESKVKASATATKVDKDGKQIVTIVLDIEKGIYLFANPVGDADFEDLRTEVSFKAKEKVSATTLYPAGKSHLMGKLRIFMYEGRTNIQANVQRAPGDLSPLEVRINVDATNLKYLCYRPGVIQLTIP